MPLITFQDITDIVLDMPDFIIGTITYQRKFTFTELKFSDYLKQVIIGGYIEFYLNGENVTGQTIFTGRQNRTMTADNTSVCYADGDYAGLTICSVDKIGDDTQSESPCYEKNYMGEYYFFREMAMHSPIVIMDMITKFLQIGIQSGRFDK